MPSVPCWGSELPSSALPRPGRLERGEGLTAGLRRAPRTLPRSGLALGTGLPAIVFVQGGCCFACQYLQRENRV